MARHLKSGRSAEQSAQDATKVQGEQANIRVRRYGHEDIPYAGVAY